MKLKGKNQQKRSEKKRNKRIKILTDKNSTKKETKLN